jgi:hypothetical protein
VYANLALHYYDDKKTHEIIKDIARVLKVGGVLAFACKSKDDHRTGQAEEVERNLFVAPNGHALRLFSEDYTRELVDEQFDVRHLDRVEEDYNGRVSAIVRCVAISRGEA